IVAFLLLTSAVCVAGTGPSAQAQDEEYGPDAPICEKAPWFCTDPVYRAPVTGEYVGHDEPALLFFSDVPGSGNSSSYTFILPKDPPTAPRQDGSGGT